MPVDARTEDAHRITRMLSKSATDVARKLSMTVVDEDTKDFSMPDHAKTLSVYGG